MGREEALLGVSLAGCAVLIVAVMTFPPVRGRIIDDEPEAVADEPEVTIAAPSKKEVLKALRARALPDGGAAAVDGHEKVLETFGWGSGRGQLGRARPRDGEPEAPMSVAIDAAGAPWVLDQVNGRMVKVAPGQPTHVPLTVRKAKDFAFASNGNAVVVNEQLAVVVAETGRVVGEYRLAKKPEGVFADGEELYVGLEGGAAQRIGNSTGVSDADRSEVPGRPSRDGRSFVSATLADGARGRVVVMGFDRSTQERRFIRELQLGMPVMNVLLLDTDAAGVLYLAALGERVPGGGSGEAVATVDLYCLDPVDGRPLTRTSLPANTSADDTFRELAALPGGGVVYLYRSETNAELRRFDCR